MEPKFNIDDRVKLITDDTIYTIIQVIEEVYKFRYKISSENNQYTLIVDEDNLTFLN